MLKLINELGSKNWPDSANDIYSILKAEFHGNKGFIKKIRNETKIDRQKKLEKLSNNFNLDVYRLDESLDQYAYDIYKINSFYEVNLLYNFTDTIRQYNYEYILYPNTATVIDYLNNSENFNLQINNILHQIISRIVNESVVNSHHSNAGIAAEKIMEAVAKSAGLTEGKHYRRQFKSREGSDTDFVFPYVEDYKDQEVDIFVAVQFTTNDRARLVSSELKEGGLKYVVSCNGMRAAKLGFDKIGDQILEGFKNKNYWLVGFKPELIKERERLQKSGRESRLDYFSNYTLSFSKFAEKLGNRYKPT